MISYYFAYSHSGGMGAFSMSLDHPVRSWDDVQAVREHIVNHRPNLNGIVILSWQRYEDPA